MKNIIINKSGGNYRLADWCESKKDLLMKYPTDYINIASRSMLKALSPETRECILND